MCISLLLNFGRILERFGAEVNLVGIPDLALIFEERYAKASLVSNQDSVASGREVFKRYESVGTHWEFVAKGASRG
jgi:hypothetical protein